MVYEMDIIPIRVLMKKKNNNIKIYRLFIEQQKAIKTCV